MQERRRKFYGWGYEGDTVRQRKPPVRIRMGQFNNR